MLTCNSKRSMLHVSIDLAIHCETMHDALADQVDEH